MLHKNFLDDFKSAAVRELENGKDINELARELKVNVSSLRAWLRKSKKKSVNASNAVAVQKISADGKLARLRAPNPHGKTTVH